MVIMNKLKSRDFCNKIIAEAAWPWDDDVHRGLGYLEWKSWLAAVHPEILGISSARAWHLRDSFHPLEHLVTAPRPSALVVVGCLFCYGRGSKPTQQSCAE